MDGMECTIIFTILVLYVVLNNLAWKTYKKVQKRKKNVPYCTLSTVLPVSVKLQGLPQTRDS